jgi:hypothetical protein
LRSGASLAEHAGMLKALVLVTLMCAPALADSTYAIDVSIKSQHTSLLVSDNSCGELQSKGPGRDSYVRVCAKPVDASRVRLDIERRSREKDDESHATAVVMAASGSTFDVLDAKLTVKLRDGK